MAVVFHLFYVLLYIPAAFRNPLKNEFQCIPDNIHLFMDWEQGNKMSVIDFSKLPNLLLFKNV